MKKAISKVLLKALQLRYDVAAILRDKSGGSSTHTDNMLYVIIGVVVAGLVLVGVYAFTNNTFLPTLWQKITDMFNYSGS